MLSYVSLTEGAVSLEYIVRCEQILVSADFEALRFGPGCSCTLISDVGLASLYGEQLCCLVVSVKSDQCF